MKKNALTLTVVANMTSNYSEGLGNIASVQKVFKNRNCVHDPGSVILDSFLHNGSVLRNLCFHFRHL